MCLAWKMLKSFVVTLIEKAHHSKCIHLCFKQWALAHKQIAASLCEGHIFYFFYQFYFCYSLLCKHHVMGKDPDTYIHSNIFDHELLLLTIISMINELAGETLSPYLPLCSMHTICSKNMLWVLAIIEDYMIIEYVKLLLRLC